MNHTITNHMIERERYYLHVMDYTLMYRVSTYIIPSHRGKKLRNYTYFTSSFRCPWLFILILIEICSCSVNFYRTQKRSVHWSVIRCSNLSWTWIWKQFYRRMLFVQYSVCPWWYPSLTRRIINIWEESEVQQNMFLRLFALGNLNVFERECFSPECLSNLYVGRKVGTPSEIPRNVAS